MKSPKIFRFMSRPTALLRPYHPRSIGPRASLHPRDFSATTRRPFVDECLVGTHTIITAVHDSTGLSWTLTIPLLAFLVRIVILTPLEVYNRRGDEKQVEIACQLERSRSAIEKDVQQKHKGENPVELRKIQNMTFRKIRKDLEKQNGAQSWKSGVLLVKCPIWLTMMETMRRMTGTEDGMSSLVATSLTTLKGKQYPEPGTADHLIPLEPSLATEGILWFDNLMVPDPLLILPFAMSMFSIFSIGRSRLGLVALPGSPLKAAMKYFYLNYRWKRCLQLGALMLWPGTLLFPSAMLLYCISTNLATVVVRPVVRFITLNIRFIQASRARSMPKPRDDKKPKPKAKSPPRMQEYRGPQRIPKKKK